MKLAISGPTQSNPSEVNVMATRAPGATVGRLVTSKTTTGGRNIVEWGLAQFSQTVHQKARDATAERAQTHKGIKFITGGDEAQEVLKLEQRFSQKNQHTHVPTQSRVPVATHHTSYTLCAVISCA